jgi:YebC/PmpR family DNA-binding regulatory protein
VSGHSKWASIKHKKAAVDAKRGKEFSKVIRGLTVAAKNGGGNPDENITLRGLVDKAKSINMPADTMEKAIKRGTGELEGVSYEQAYYEGYGPGGTAIYIETLTDSKNRTTANIRSILTKGNGKMGEAGCTAWLFEPRGYVEVATADIDEEALLELAADCGADDIESTEEAHTVTCDYPSYDKLKKALEAKEITPRLAERSMAPQNTVKLEGKEAAQMLRLMDQLEENDDVQNTYANFDIDIELMEQETTG